MSNKNPSSFNSANRRSLRYERLERRRVLDASIQAFLIGDTLTDDSQPGIEQTEIQVDVAVDDVQELQNGRVLISGVPAETSLSVGAQVSQNQWLVELEDVAQFSLLTPSERPELELTFELFGGEVFSLLAETDVYFGTDNDNTIQANETLDAVFGFDGFDRVVIDDDAAGYFISEVVEFEASFMLSNLDAELDLYFESIEEFEFRDRTIRFEDLLEQSQRGGDDTGDGENPGDSIPEDQSDDDDEAENDRDPNDDMSERDDPPGDDETSDNESSNDGSQSESEQASDDPQIPNEDMSDQNSVDDDDEVDDDREDENENDESQNDETSDREDRGNPPPEDDEISAGEPADEDDMSAGEVVTDVEDDNQPEDTDSQQDDSDDGFASEDLPPQEPSTIIDEDDEVLDEEEAPPTEEIESDEVQEEALPSLENEPTLDDEPASTAETETNGEPDGQPAPINARLFAAAVAGASSSMSGVSSSSASSSSVSSQAMAAMISSGMISSGMMSSSSESSSDDDSDSMTDGQPAVPATSSEDESSDEESGSNEQATAPTADEKSALAGSEATEKQAGVDSDSQSSAQHGNSVATKDAIANSNSDAAVEIPVEDQHESTSGESTQLVLAEQVLPAFEADQFYSSMDSVKQQLLDDSGHTEIMVGTGVVVAAGYSLAQIAWLLRSGVLAAKLMASLPMSVTLDPLPLLNCPKARTTARKNNAESLLDMLNNKS